MGASYIIGAHVRSTGKICQGDEGVMDLSSALTYDVTLRRTLGLTCEEPEMDVDVIDKMSTEQSRHSLP